MSHKLLWKLTMAVLVEGSLAFAGSGEIAVKTLPNGLTVAVQEDHTAPVVAIQYWVRAGSRTEMEEEAGITHFIEHMIFKGTPSMGPGELARVIESSGGTINAYTSLDQTVYHVTIASRFAKVGLEVLTDSIQNVLFDPQEMEQEKKVILEEMRMDEDRPQSRLSKALWAEVFKVHPYGRPIIGRPETISRFTREDLLAYMKRLYKPRNMFLVVVGDVEPGKVFQWAEELWRDRPDEGDVEFAILREPPQEGLRKVILRQRASEAHMGIAFPVPDARHPDSPALDVLSSILADGESSRLEREVRVQRGLVYSISARSLSLMDPGIFVVQGSLDPTKLREALPAILKELYKLTYEKVSQAELQRAKLQVEASLMWAKEKVQGKARLLGESLCVMGDSRYEKVYMEQIRKLTQEDIMRVAREYFQPSRLTVGILLPEEQDEKMGPEELEVLAKKAEEKEEVGPLPSKGVHGPVVQKEVLSNGLVLLVKESHDVPTVSIRAAFLGGSRFESRETSGLSKAVAQLLTRGTNSRSASQLAEEVETLAGSLEGFSGWNSIGLEARFLSKFFPNAMELLADCLTNSTFPHEELEKERPRLLASVRRERDHPTRMVMRLFRETLFRVHPYGLPQDGTEESIASLKREDLVEYASRFIVPQRGVVAIVGDVSFQEALKWAKRYLEGWRAQGSELPQVPQEPPMDSPRSAWEKLELKQAHIVMGFPSTHLRSPDKYALDVLDAILSGQGGRLFRELRDRQGLAYSVTSFSRLGLDAGYFGTYIATSPENIQKALDGLREEIRKAREELPSLEELEGAKRNIIGTYEIGQQTHSAQAATIAFDELYGLGYDYGPRYLESIQRVTAEEVLGVARKYLRPDRMVTAIVGPGS
jgi:zinc protease